jgi:hypothetical protein
MENELNSSKQQAGWKELLEEHLKKSHSSVASQEDQDKQSVEDFLEMIKPEEQLGKTIPKFFFKKQVTYNDLNFLVKTEAKSRFLSMKTFDIPSKKRKFIKRYI